MNVLISTKPVNWRTSLASAKRLLVEWLRTGGFLNRRGTTETIGVSGRSKRFKSSRKSSSN